MAVNTIAERSAVKAGDESFERLRAALQEIATSDAGELLADARAEARVRVRSMLSVAAHRKNGKRSGSLSPRVGIGRPLRSLNSCR